MPIATPPAMRQTTNQLKLSAQPVSTDDTANSTPEASSSRLRPKRSERPPEASEPARQPSSAQELAQPTIASLRRSK